MYDCIRQTRRAFQCVSQHGSAKAHGFSDGEIVTVDPVVRLAIASGSNPELWHIMDSAAITQDDVLRYYKLTKV